MADFLLSHSYLILAFPFLSFLVIGLWLEKTQPQQSGFLALGASLLSMFFCLGVSWAYFKTVLGDAQNYPDRTLISLDLAWLNFSPGLTANMGIYLDPISVMMLVVITVISFLVNFHSIGYMKGDPGFGRFFSLLSLFSFSMLGLVVSSNILQMFVFWELVGVSSYALIGFWYHKPSAVAASKKAFIITRFGDAFFLLGILTVSFFTGSFDFQTLNSPETAAELNRTFLVGGAAFNLLTVATVLIFAGGWGKSAMFPLHVWLPDAMEGPTPVSSIIHSATMVVAGVYLTARLFPLFSHAPGTLDLIRFLGAFTALFAAAIAVVQTDIKRILAFSTLSQLGYMLFSLGSAPMVLEDSQLGGINPLGYSAAMFHVFTHAFFKCMLFLGAGVVIHAVHTNEIMAMGGLKKQLPRTYWSLLAGCLAIAGIFPFSGFWSKDAILLGALQSGHHLTFLVGLVTGGLTAFYMFRFFLLIFHGKPRSERHDIHEDPWMVLPIMALAIPAMGAGVLEHFFLTEVTISTGVAAELPHPFWLPVLASLTGLGGAGPAWYLYGQDSLGDAQRIRERFQAFHRILSHKFYIDELYLFTVHSVIFRCIATPVKWFDRLVVDGAMNLCGYLLQWGGRAVRFSQSGQLQFYLGITVVGLVFLLFIGH